jgi:hypothetical protein
MIVEDASAADMGFGDANQPRRLGPRSPYNKPTSKPSRNVYPNPLVPASATEPVPESASQPGVRSDKPSRLPKSSGPKRGVGLQGEMPAHEASAIDPYDPADFNRKLPKRDPAAPAILDTPAAKALHGNDADR